MHAELESLQCALAAVEQLASSERAPVADVNTEVKQALEAEVKQALKREAALEREVGALRCRPTVDQLEAVRQAAQVCCNGFMGGPFEFAGLLSMGSGGGAELMDGFGLGLG